MPLYKYMLYEWLEQRHAFKTKKWGPSQHDMRPSIHAATHHYADVPITLNHTLLLPTAPVWRST